MNTKTSSKVSLAIAIVLATAAIINYFAIQRSKDQLQREQTQTVSQKTVPSTESPPSFIKKRRPPAAIEMNAPDWPKPLVDKQAQENEIDQMSENIPDLSDDM